MPKRANRGRRGMRKSGKTSVSPAIKKYVKRVVNGNTENKIWVKQASNVALSTTSAAGTPVNISCLPEPSSGSGDGDRIGAKINCKKSYIRGFVNLLPYDAVTNSNPLPIYIKMWLFSIKYVNTNTLSSAGLVATDFFKVTNSNTGFNGTMRDITIETNSDLLTVYKTKTFKLGSSAYTSGVGTVNSYQDNSPMTAPFYFNLTKIIKTLKFNESTTYATNKNLFLAFQAVSASSPVPGVTPAEIHYNNYVSFEDA